MTDHAFARQGIEIWDRGVLTAPLDGSEDEVAWAYIKVVLDVIALVDYRFALRCQRHMQRHRTGRAALRDKFFRNHLAPRSLPFALFCVCVRRRMETVPV